MDHILPGKIRIWYQKREIGVTPGERRLPWVVGSCSVRGGGSRLMARTPRTASLRRVDPVMAALLALRSAADESGQPAAE
jgi:hypothetical protein